jgi:hypothetical protein
MARARQRKVRVAHAFVPTPTIHFSYDFRTRKTHVIAHLYRKLRSLIVFRGIARKALKAVVSYRNVSILYSFAPSFPKKCDLWIT